MRTSRALLPFLTLLAACALDTPQQYLVPDLRILAIRGWVGSAAPPIADADEGQLVQLEALVANPRGRTSVTVDWYACPAIVEPAVSPCTSEDVLRDLATFPGQPGVVSITSTYDEATGVSAASLNLAVLATPLAIGDAAEQVRLAAVKATEPQCKLYAEIPLVAIARATDVSPEAALKRVRLYPAARLASNPQDKYLPNRTPEIVGINAGATDPETCTDGVPVEAATLGAEVNLCGALPASTDQYSHCDPNLLPDKWEKLDEEIQWQWYVTSGTIEGASFDGNVTTRSIDLTPAPGDFTLWLIARDGRGGTTWRRWDRVVVP